MSRGNPFQKGHKKMGGRKPGTPNKFSRELKQAIIAAGEHVGLDGKGLGGLTGYLARLAVTHPPSYASLLARVLSLPEAPAERKHSIDPTKLTDDELGNFAHIVAKAQVPIDLDESDDVSLQPTDDDDDQFREKIGELLKEQQKKSSEKNRHKFV